ncbi:MAG: fibronectin type III domain-containing protein, partial [Bacteroidales bacterium]|nr:fibronectin type III domain-containing protein [Bacteroidales bacterium]
MKRFYKFLMPLVAIVAMALPLSVQAQEASMYTFATGIDNTQWVTLSSGASSVPSNVYGDDSISGVLNIGFTFRFAGVDYTQWSCNSNGRVRLGATPVSINWLNPFTTQSLTSSSYGSDVPVIAAFGMDNTLAGSGVWVKYEVVGTAPSRTLVIEYRTPSEYDEEGDLVNYQIQLEEGTNVVRFVYGTTAASTYDEFQAGIASDIDNCLTVSSTHTTIVGPTTTTLSAWPGEGRYYEFTPPTSFCSRVASFAVASLEPNAITVSWVDNNSNSWLVRIDSASVTGTPVAVTDTFYTFNQLDAQTQYVVNVAALCDNGDTSVWRSITTTTPCAFIDSIPYTYGFEGATTGGSSNATFAAPCWTRNTGSSTSYYPYISSSSTYCHTGSRGLYWYGSSSYDHVLVLPGVDVTLNPINTLQLKFWAKASGTSYHPALEVGVMTDPGNMSTFEQVATVHIEGTTWTEYEAFLSTYTGTGNFIAVRAHNPSSYWYAYLDDFTLDLMPACPYVSSVVVDSATTDSMFVHWVASGSESSWAVYLNDSLVDVATSANYVFTDLDVNTIYTVGVRALCDNGDTSDVVTATGRTMAGDPISVFPYSCGFETYENEYGEMVNEAVDWILENGTQANYWMVGNDAHNGSGTKALYITNDGSSNAYTVGSASYVFAYAVFSFEAGEYAYSFDWLANGESSFDFIRAAVVPNTVEFTAGGYCGFNNSSAVPAGGQAIDGAARLNLVSTWQTKTGTFDIATDGLYKMVFMWRNDGSGGTQPPAAIDNISIIRNTCPAPTLFTVTTSGDTANFTWTDAAGTAWDLAYVAEGMTPGEDDVISVNATTYQVADLATGFYDAYVRTNCGSDDVSLWVGPVNFSVGIDVVTIDATGTDTLHTCGAIIYDNGGPTGAYSTYCESTLIIYPNQEGSVLSVSGWSYTESTWDYLYIYEGVGTTGTVLWHDNISGSQVRPIETMMVDGPITIRFHSDGSTQYDGFQLNVSCVAPPNCQRPETFHLLSLLPDSAEFSWTDNTNSNWGIEYGPAGFTRGNENDTNIHWALFSDTTGWVTGLTPSVNYDFYLVALCSDTSWARQITAQTPCMAIPDSALPYHYGFEDATTANFNPCWRKFNVGNSTTYPQVSTSYAAEGTKSLYFYGYSNSYCSYAVMPMFETPMNELMMEFKLYKTSATYGSIEVGVMTNPSDISTFQTIGIYQPEALSTWETFRVNLGTYNGTGRFIAFLQRSTYYTYLDDITVFLRPSCPNPVNVDIQAVSSSSAYATWTYAAGYETVPDAYRLTLVGADNVVDTIITGITATNYTITGLTPGTEYSIRVESECEGSYSEAASATFKTVSLACLMIDSTTITQVIDTIGNGTATDSYFPYYTLYNYCVTQQIYTAEEIGHAGTISKLAFNMSSVGNPTRTVEIYMGHTNVASTTDWLTTNLTQVYSGPAITLTTGWNTINLTTPFSYNGNDNLVIVFRDNSGSWSSTNSVYGTSGSTSGVSRYVYNDNSSYTLSSMTGGTASTFRMNLVLHSTGYGCALLDSCVAPMVTVTDLGDTSLNLVWAPGFNDTAWTVEHKAAGDSVWTVDLTNTTLTSRAYTGLQPSTKYMFRVSHACGDTIKAAVYTVTTKCQPSAVPFSENFSSWVAGTGATAVTPACWYRGTNATSTYPYVSESYFMSGGKSMYMYSSNSTYSYLVLPKMDAPMDTLMLSFYLYKGNTSYTHALNVGVMTDPEDVSTFTQVGTATPSALNTWQGFEFSMAGAPEGYIAIMSPNAVYSYPYLDNLEVNYYNPCVRPQNVHSSAILTDSATISWVDTVTNNFEVEYGPVGFAQGTGTVISVTGNSTILAGLAHSTRYDVYVRGVCGNTTSEWSFVHTFATQCAPIDVLPFTENFNNWGTGHLPNCWSNA